MAVNMGVHTGYPGGLTQVNNASLELDRYWRKIIIKSISKGLI
jgi:hypothetical protein